LLAFVVLVNFFSFAAIVGQGVGEEEEGEETFLTSSGISGVAVAAVADNVVVAVCSIVSAGIFVRRDLVERSSIIGDSSIVFITGDASSVFATIKGVFGGELVVVLSNTAAAAFLRRFVGRFVVVDIDASSLSELDKDGDVLLAVDVDTRPALYKRFELQEYKKIINISFSIN
jgi:hypothetical protein